MKKSENTLKLEKLLFTEFRYIVADADNDNISNESLVNAVTANTNIQAYGYTFMPVDVVDTVAKIARPEELYSKIKSFIPEVTAKPMYPDFPNQVVAMDEAQYRFHQLMHYASTYGVEFKEQIMKLLTGVDETAEIQRGWLPSVAYTEKRKEDELLVELKTLQIIPEINMFSSPFKRILTKRERMTEKDGQIIELICELAPEEVSAMLPIEIPFKENLKTLVNLIMKLDKEKALLIMSGICQHTGDVLKCLEVRTKNQKYHLSRPEKRFWVTLIETKYSALDWECNLMLSNKKAKKNVTSLQFIDYNRYSTSSNHMEAVRKLRNGELKSWESGLKATISKNIADGLVYAATRPGNLLRMIVWFLRLGVDKHEIEDILISNSSSLSIQTLLDVLNYFKNENAKTYAQDFKKIGSADEEAVAKVLQSKEREKETAGTILKNVLNARLQVTETPLRKEIDEVANDGTTYKRPRKVYIDESVFDLKQSKMLGNAKSVEGGYLRNGLAIKVAENVNTIRLFTYWNDKHRVDLDLHAEAIKEDQTSFHVGWNDQYKAFGVVMSGDITHSDAAEYIDIDIDRVIENKIHEVSLRLDLFCGEPDFKSIDTCFSGILAVNSLNEDVKLYNPKNCYFSFENTAKCNEEIIGKFFPKKRILELATTNAEKDISCQDLHTPYIKQKQLSKEIGFSMYDYLKMLVKSQNAELVSSKEEADTILRIEKAESEEEISLTDNNYFMDAPTTESQD